MATPGSKIHGKSAGIAVPLWKNKNVRIGAIVAAMALAGGVTYGLWPSNRDAEVAAAAKQLEGKSPEEWRRVMENGSIPREVAWEAMGQARDAEMQKRMDTFFALKTPAERNKFLDQTINEMEALRKQWEARAATQPSMDRNRQGQGRRGDGPTSQPSDARRKEMEQRRAQRQDSQPPEKRAQRAEFMVAVRKRMQERGIQPPEGGRGFGGFGGGPRGPGGGGGDRGGR